MNNIFLEILLVGMGGFLGSVLRFGFSKLAQHLDLAFLPYSTLSVNILGSFILGFLMEIFLNTKILNPYLGLFLTVGFCGGFTTFSTFSYENIMMLRDGQFLQPALYIAGSLLGGLAAMYLGFISAKYMITG